jgi:hypothetical protein
MPESQANIPDPDHEREDQFDRELDEFEDEEEESED